VNDPNNTTLCDGLHGDPAMDAGALADAGCYLSDVDVEAAILALQHSFIVNNYGNSSKTINYSINQFGATAENFFELFVTSRATAHCRPATTPCPPGTTASASSAHRRT